MPFITEEIYQALPNKDMESIMISSFPQVIKKLINPQIEEQMETLKKVITSIRNLRILLNIKPTQAVNVTFATKDEDKINLLKKSVTMFPSLVHTGQLEFLHDSSGIKKAAVNVTDNIEIFIMLEGLIDIEQEKKRLMESAKKMKMELEQIEKKLSNKDFVNKAKKEAVDKAKEQEAKIKTDLTLLDRNISLL